MLMFYNVFGKSKENVFVPINIPLQGTIDLSMCPQFVYLFAHFFFDSF